MSDADLVFLPWVRRGAAAGILAPDTFGAGQPGQASAPVSVTVNGVASVSVPMTIMGPGHVTGLDGRQVIRTDPAPGSHSFEPNYLPLIELDEPALPWLFTPAAAGGQARLRPWLCLVVVRIQPGVRLDPPQGGAPLPVLRVQGPARPAVELPDPAESWAWAHAQVTAAAGADLGAGLANPAGSLARLLCPRVLAPDTQYLACVVPAFELGRKAGLGQDITPADEAQLAPAWSVTSAAVELPVYYSWTFSTGAGGDFQSLAMLLTARPLPPGIGEKEVNVDHSGLDVELPTGTTFPVAGALQPVGAAPRGWSTTDLQTAWETRLVPVLNAPALLSDGDPLLAPTLYGAVAAGHDRIDPAHAARWFEQLNLSPGYRAVAHLGTRVVQRLQDQLMASAWAQAADVARANQLRRQAELGHRLVGSLRVRHVAPMAAAVGLLVLAPAQFRMARVPGPFASALIATGLDPSDYATALRRVARPRGAINRRVQVATVAAATVAAAVPAAIPRTTAILARLQPAATQARFAVYVRPPGEITLARLAASLTPPQTDFTWIGSTSAAVAAIRAHDRFVFVPPGQMVPVRGPNIRTRPGPQDTDAARQFRTLAEAHLARFNPLRIDIIGRTGDDGSLDDAFTQAVSGPAPGGSFAARKLAAATTSSLSNVDSQLLSPAFPQPMSQALVEVAQDLVLPGLDRVPPNTAVALETNTAFVQAFLVGLNTEMGRELLWRGFPADLTATYFDRFWDASSAPGRGPDIDAIATWGDRAVGTGVSTEDFVLLVRSELLRRYPDAVIFAVRGAEERHPIFTGGFAPDVKYAGFDIPVADIRTWSIVLMEHPSAPRFGVEVGTDTGQATHLPAAGDTNAATAAQRLRQLPVRITIPATVLLGEVLMPIPVVNLAPLLAAPGPTTALGPSTFPLALFPVRLETRYFFNASQVAELRIRVYPDKIHLDAHDPDLTPAEVAAGQRYWRALWPAGSDDAAALRAWQELAGQYSPRRAAWIQRRLTPTNQADRPGGTPHFPTVAPPAANPRTPRVRLLPDRWIATAFVNGTRAATVTGRDIVPNLAVGPDLAAPVTIDDERPAIDDGMRWMIDFDAAEQAGMGLRMTLPGNGNVDLLLVTGVSLRDRSADVAAQLDVHHYTDGLEFVAPATPTNNTAAGRTPYQEADPTFELSFAREVRPAATESRSYAELMRRAFGVDVFAHLGGAHNTDEVAAAAMATALWPATFGYFLSTMVGLRPGGLGVNGLDSVRRHALTFLRPGGPLPVLRAGAQPYGVLPVTSLDVWQINGNDAASAVLRAGLVALRNSAWRPAAAGRIARLGNTDDPNTDLADVLQTAALSTSFAVRGVMGAHFLEHLRAMLSTNPEPPNYGQRLFQLTSAMAQAFGVDIGQVLTRLTYEETAHAVRTPLVGTPSYVAELLALTDLDALASPVPAAAEPLLKVLLRHALLRSYAEAAARLLNQPSAPVADLLREAELVDLVPGTPPTQTWRRQRDAFFPGTTTTIRDRLTQAPGPLISEFRSALAALAQADSSTLERQLVGTLDATSHRLDAWVTSLATRRLAEQRLSQPAGLSVGGYAWVENLRPAPARPVVAAVLGEPGPLTATSNQAGFIHAPSLNQASTAALLRNAHLAHGGGPDSPFAVDLSSGRIRLVRQLFEGVRQGQPLGALLGYTLERRLHEAGLDDLIDPFRALAPLPGAATPTQVRRLVVDGLALSTLWQSDRDRVLASLPATDTRRPAAARILDALEAAVDAASDAVQAEAAFQMVRGNLSRTAGSLDGISTGESPPPDLGFLKTPRTGVGVTHRVAMVLPAGDTTPGPGWASNTPRALAEPVVNAWAGRLLGPATALSARVEELDDAGEVTLTHLVPFPALGLAAIDLVWMMAGADGVPLELTQRVLAAATGGSGVASARLRVDLGRAGTARSVADVVEVAARAQQLLAGARSLDAGDLLAPHAQPVRGLDLDEFERRAVAAERALAAARTTLAAALAAASSASMDALRRAMLDVAAFGVPGALPTSDGPATAQAQALLVELDRRLSTAPPAPATDAAGRRDQLQTRFRTVFGSGFLALPRFTAANAPDVAASLADAVALRGDDPLAAHTWLLRMERVRTGLARLGRPLREAEVLGTGERLNLSIAQVPHVPGQRWLGLPLAAGTTPADGRLSLVLQQAPSRLDGQLCGIMVDEWTELIPSASETTGVAFQFDPPDSVAPQAILLAVPPVLGRPWSVDLLNRVLIETLELARLRLVGPGALGDVRHFVPAAFLAFNLDADTVSTDLVPLTT